MEQPGVSGWMKAWSILLLFAAFWLLVDRRTVEHMLDRAIYEVDIRSALGLGLATVAIINLGALAVRILMWNKE